MDINILIFISTEKKGKKENEKVISFIKRKKK